MVGAQVGDELADIGWISERSGGHQIEVERLVDRAARDVGMVIAVEPGVYLPGRFGVRMENVYVVTEEGGKDLLSMYGD